jgi:putative methionine-R-sulfoxide reductase with GAF domain
MLDEERTIIRILSVFMVVALLGSTLVLIFSLVTSQGSFTTSYTMAGLVCVITCLVVLWLLRIRQFFIPRIILPSIVYLLAGYLIFTGATVGIRDDAVLLFSLTVAMAGLLLGKKGVIIFGALSLTIVGISVFAEINGLIVNHISAHTTTYTTLITVSVIYGLTFGMMFLLVSILSNNLARMRSGQQELEKANQELLSIRESLERQVTERTRAADSARADAEVARREAEAQAWFTLGQAQLAEQMRGELDLPTLANNVTSHLTQYIGAQAGVLFIATGNVLKLIGRYAYMDRPDRKSEFLVGENLVGEAAKTGRMILVEDIPLDALRISSALGDAKPNQILIVPLESNGQVLGVLEFATLTRFTSDHETFLKRVSESVAIALRTLQTRLQMSELLIQSQRQAEELQVQSDFARPAKNQEAE